MPELTEFDTPVPRISKKKLKLVDFFGVPILVHKKYKWIAMDANGEVYGYVTEPQYNHNRGHFMLKVHSDECIQLGVVKMPKGACASHYIAKVKDLTAIPF